MIVTEDETDDGAVSIEVVAITVEAEVVAAAESVGNGVKETAEIIGADRDHAADPGNLPAQAVGD